MIVQYTQHTTIFLWTKQKNGQNSSDADLRRQSGEELMNFCVVLETVTMLN